VHVRRAAGGGSQNSWKTRGLTSASRTRCGNRSRRATQAWSAGAEHQDPDRRSRGGRQTAAKALRLESEGLVYRAPRLGSTCQSASATSVLARVFAGPSQLQVFSSQCVLRASETLGLRKAGPRSGFDSEAVWRRNGICGPSYNVNGPTGSALSNRHSGRPNGRRRRQYGIVSRPSVPPYGKRPRPSESVSTCISRIARLRRLRWPLTCRPASSSLTRS
jgi:hypothetical protein